MNHAHEDVRSRPVAAPTAQLWRAVEGMHSEGYSAPVRLLWAARGLADRALGGVGTRRGRRDPDRLEVGDRLDFWRVEEVVRGERLMLRAQMRLPGTATLELLVSGAGPTSVLTARGTFLTSGLAGDAYWWSVAPFHRLVFGRMMGSVARVAEARTAREEEH